MGDWLIFLTESCIFWHLPELNFPYTPSLDYMELLEGKPGGNGGNLCLWIWEEKKSELIPPLPLSLHHDRDPSCLAEWPAGITSFFYYTRTLIPPTFFGIVICGLEWTTGHSYLAQHREKKEGHMCHGPFPTDCFGAPVVYNSHFELYIVLQYSSE